NSSLADDQAADDDPTYPRNPCSDHPCLSASAARQRSQPCTRRRRDGSGSGREFQTDARPGQGVETTARSCAVERGIECDQHDGDTNCADVCTGFGLCCRTCGYRDGSFAATPSHCDENWNGGNRWWDYRWPGTQQGRCLQGAWQA